MELLPTDDYQACVLAGKDSMYPYFKENGVDWNLEERLKIYSTLEIYEVIDDDLIGYLALREKDGQFFLSDLQIFEKYRNKGYGTKLLQMVKEIAKNRGHNAVYLKVFKTSPALNFYLRNEWGHVTEEKYVYVLSSNTYPAA